MLLAARLKRSESVVTVQSIGTSRSNNADVTEADRK